jgi:hypothetical protein
VELPDYWLPRPCHLADDRGLVLHGSGNPAIELFEPRQSIGPVDSRSILYSWPMK